MVDVSAKPITARRAVAEATVSMSAETLSLVIDGGGPKGDVLGVAELAGVMGGKKTSELIPLCHPLPLTDLQVSITPERAGGLLRIRAEAATTGQTGVEMEAMTAASVAALTVYDMVKGVERGVTISAVRLIAKSGGKSGDWVRHDPPGSGGGGRTRGARLSARSAGGRAHRQAAAPGRPWRQADRMKRAVVITASDKVSEGVREDTSGIGVGERLEALGYTVQRAVLPDEQEMLTEVLRSTAETHDLIVTTGGTGLTPRDVTPQATKAAIDYEVPGMAEAMRAAGRLSTPYADLSRSVVGVIGRTLVVNLPGSPRGAMESLAAIEGVLDHAVETLAGPHDHDEGQEPTA